MKETIENYQEAMDVCLKLWKSLSGCVEHQDKDTILEELGYKCLENDCPFCQLYWQKDTCYDCPIYIYSEDKEYHCEDDECPFLAWQDEPPMDNALAFYKFLLKVKEALTEDGSALKE